LYLFYRKLSWDAAHPSVTALSRYLPSGDDTLWWGPESRESEVEDTLNICLPAVFGAVIVCAEMLGLPALHLEASNLWHRYKAINEVAPASDRPKPGTTRVKGARPKEGW
jgi:hypothetical protein